MSKFSLSICSSKDEEKNEPKFCSREESDFFNKAIDEKFVSTECMIRNIVRKSALNSISNGLTMRMRSKMKIRLK